MLDIHFFAKASRLEYSSLDLVTDDTACLPLLFAHSMIIEVNYSTITVSNLTRLVLERHDDIDEIVRIITKYLNG